MHMKEILKKIPVIGTVARYIYRIISPPVPFENSEEYWKRRYEINGNSGDGSYNQLAEFKADVLNAFVSKNEIASVIEYGCGDGNQLSLARYPKYLGFDVSPKALSICSQKFSKDEAKNFKLMGEYNGETADLTLSLDVIYHLIEDSTFHSYMNRLFDSSKKFVIIYSSDTDKKGVFPHVKHRHFSKWITDNKTKWKLLEHIPNRYPFDGKNGSLADFYIYSQI